MTPEDISYALAKQLASATAIESSYGQIMLDDELRQAVDAAARPILERRMKEAENWIAFGEWFEGRHGASMIDIYVGKKITPELVQEIIRAAEDYRADVHAGREAAQYITPLARALDFDGEVGA